MQNSLSLAVLMLPLLAIFSCPSETPAQASQSSYAMSAFDARATVQKAIKVMGGETAWRAAGGASSNISLQIGSAVIQSAWVDDWSTGVHRLVRQTSGKRGELVARSNGQTHHKHLLPSISDNAELARVYPAVVLILGLRDANCSFTRSEVTSRAVANTNSKETVSVQQLCQHAGSLSDPLEWEFSTTTGLPTSLSVPSAPSTNLGGLRVRTEFSAYATTDMLVHPVTVTIILPGGAKQIEQITNTKWTPALPDSEFVGGDR